MPPESEAIPMRKPILVVAAAASVYAITSAFAAGTLTAGAQTINGNTYASNAVTFNSCEATAATFTYTQETDTASSNYGKITQVLVTVSRAAGASGALGNCGAVRLSIDGVNSGPKTVFAAETNNGTVSTRATEAITLSNPVDSTKTIGAVISVA